MIEPAHLWVPPRVGSYGDEAVDLVRLCRPKEQWPDEEQRLAIDALLSFGPGGRWAALESVVVESRQNGKTTNGLEPVTLFDLYMLPPDRIVWTAHLFRTSRAAFADFCAMIEYSSELSRRTKKVSYSHGEEFIETTKGARLEFLARERGGGRGLSGKRVVFDEALILSASAMGALLPVLSARDDPQVTYGSSAGKKDSSQLHRLMKRGRRGGDDSLIYVEWRAPGSWLEPPCSLGRHCPHTVDVEGCALDDVELWQKANHTLGKRISVDYVRAERKALDPVEFGRERLGWEETPAEVSNVIDMDKWAARRDPESAATGVVAFALDSSPERHMSSIGLTGRREDGKLHRQLLQRGPGMGWLLDAAVELNRDVRNCGWYVDPSSPAGSLIPDMERAGLTVHQVSGRELSQACVAILNGAVDDSGYHVCDPLLEQALDQAWRDCVAMPYGDSIRFARVKANGDISPVMVLTLSDHGFRVSGDAQYDLMESFW